MSVLKQVVLLSLLGAIVSTGPDDCEALMKRLPTTELSKVLGDWVLVWAVSDSGYSSYLLQNVISSYVELKAAPDNRTVVFHQRSVYPVSPNKTVCHTLIINMTVGSEHLSLHGVDMKMDVDGVPDNFTQSSEAHFYESCPDCLLMEFRGSESGRSLLSYRREGSHQDVDDLKTDHDHLKKRAECLKFPTERPYSYDGTADFCHKRSAADVKPEES